MRQKHLFSLVEWREIEYITDCEIFGSIYSKPLFAWFQFFCGVTYSTDGSKDARRPKHGDLGLHY